MTKDIYNEDLIKAAPLLLQMCELSLEMFELLQEVIPNPRIRILMSSMRRTIALAKGESQNGKGKE